MRNGTASRETQIIANHDGAATRQSNTGSGLAAIYGCRRDDRECTRHVNLREGPAAHFSTRGGVPFSIDPSATGVVEGLNADKIDGLDASDLAARFGASSGPPGPAGPQGKTGPRGPQGEVGPRGVDGASGATSVVVRERTATHSSISTLQLDVFCETGERATGGGGSSSRFADFQALELSRPGVRTVDESGPSAREPTAGETPNAWRIRTENTTEDSRAVKVWVMCAAP